MTAPCGYGEWLLEALRQILDHEAREMLLAFATHCGLRPPNVTAIGSQEYLFRQKEVVTGENVQLLSRQSIVSN